MAAAQMDAPSSFHHLVDNIPQWLAQLDQLSKHAATKKAEFSAEYARLVKSIKPKRVKSPSVASIHSDEDKSIKLPESQQPDESAMDKPDVVEVDPLEAGNRHLYADQLQRKRKMEASMRSGASGPQKFRSKHQVVIHYDSHVQAEFEAMVKAVGIARNNLRKGRNALNASRGFRLPTLAKRYDASSFTSPSMDNIRSIGKYRTGPGLSGHAKYAMRPPVSQPQDEVEAAFLDSDKVLESVQGLFETAAHQFLRDGDCDKEIDGAKLKLSDLLDTARTVAATLREKAKQQEAEDEDPSSIPNLSHSQSVSDLGCPSLLSDKSSLEPLNMPPISPKSVLPALSQTLDDMRAKGVVSQPVLPQGGTTIEVDDSSDAGSLGEIDISQFRSQTRLRMRA